MAAPKISPIQKRLVNQLESKGHTQKEAMAISTSSLQRAGDLKKGSNKPTPQGTTRGKQTPSQRLAGRRARAKGKKV